jgi:peroxiredoxin
LRSFQQHIPEFNARGIRVAAVSTDSEEVTRDHCLKRGFTFSFLSDARAEVVGRYNLLHPGGGPGGADISRPAEFLVDPTGTVRWRKLTDSVIVRARPEEVLEAFDGLKAAMSVVPGKGVTQ